MNRIESVFRSGHKALIPYLTVGYPSVARTVDAGVVLAQSGCDIIELGIPFSDPIADGVTIQKAGFQALQQGVTPEACLDVAKRLRKKIDTPLVFMTYYNPVFSYGLEAFCRASIESGIDGLIIPDLPPEEGTELEAITRQLNLDLIYLLSPTSSDERIRLVGERSAGFIYLVSVTGVTGARKSLPAGLEDFVRRVRAKTTLPLCVGFGVSTVAQAKRIARMADGVIVGSRLIQLIEEDATLNSLKTFVSDLHTGLNSTMK